MTVLAGTDAKVVAAVDVAAVGGGGGSDGSGAAAAADAAPPFSTAGTAGAAFGGACATTGEDTEAKVDEDGKDNGAADKGAAAPPVGVAENEKSAVEGTAAGFGPASDDAPPPSARCVENPATLPLPFPLLVKLPRESSTTCSRSVWRGGGRRRAG